MPNPKAVEEAVRSVLEIRVPTGTYTNLAHLITAFNAVPMPEPRAILCFSEPDIPAGIPFVPGGDEPDCKGPHTPLYAVEWPGGAG